MTDWKATHKAEIVEHLRRFYQVSWDWRSTGSPSMHQNWDRWERNYHSIYDPEIKAKKEPWQATMFDPMTVGNVEVIVSALTKILLGNKRAVALEPRNMGTELQAELHTDILDYEVDRSQFALGFYDTEKESAIFGSGFMKFYPEKKTAKRRILRPVREGITEAFKNLRRPGQVKGFRESIEEVVIKNNVGCKMVHIRNIFLEPNARDLRRVLERQKITYGELKELSEQTNSDGEPLIDPESVKQLWGYYESDKFEMDIVPVQYDLGHLDPTLPRPTYDKNHTVWEFWGPVPRKWVELDLPEDTDEERDIANEIVDGKLMAASGMFFLASEENPMSSMEPPYLQLDYIRCGQTYGKGVCQLMEGIQEESNEIRNLRVDNVNLILNKIFVGIEKYLVDQKELRSSPGAVIRLRDKGGQLDDVRKAVMALEVPDVAISGFRETQELERKAQEVTGATRVTLGTAGQTRDANQTATGMELLKQAAFDRFTVTAFVQERAFLVNAARKIMEISYQISDLERLKRILGMHPVEILPGQLIPKWQAFKKLPPHELDQDYDFVPAGVFTMDNKQQKAQQMMSFGQFLFSVLPQTDPKPIVERLAYLNGFSSDEIADILKGLPQGSIQTPMGMGQGIPSIGGMPSGPNGSPARTPPPQAPARSPAMPMSPPALGGQPPGMGR